jgi:PAS domain S-box-containing protein
MTARGTEPEHGDQLLDPILAGVLGGGHFKQFLDHVPVAIAVAELQPAEKIIYANIALAQLTGRAGETLEGRDWTALAGSADTDQDGRRLGDAILADQDYVGAFTLECEGGSVAVDAWSNIILDEAGKPAFRLVALAEAGDRGGEDRERLEALLQEKDVLLWELQHRVKNNLQMITALIRVEARALPDHAIGASFDRLAGRVESLALLYRALGADSHGESIDLGVYLSQIASAVMTSHAVEGIRLDLQVDTWPVSVNVAMPAGLVVNELLTNALKHAFAGREGGTIRLHSLVEEDGCRVIVGDDGVGLPAGSEWPRHGKLSAMIVQSLRRNAKARIDIASAPGEGMQVTIFFARENAAA